MEDNLIVIMLCQVLQTLIRQEVIHCGGSPVTGWCDECEYGFRNEKGYRQCFAPDIDGMEKVGRIKPKEKNDACD
jgi:hypothetical protein